MSPRDARRRLSSRRSDSDERQNPIVYRLSDSPCEAQRVAVSIEEGINGTSTRQPVSVMVRPEWRSMRLVKLPVFWAKSPIAATGLCSGARIRRGACRTEADPRNSKRENSARQSLLRHRIDFAQFLMPSLFQDLANQCRVCFVGWKQRSAGPPQLSTKRLSKKSVINV